MSILDTAAELVNGDRQHNYGNPVDNMARIGTIWGAILDMDEPIPPATVALMLAGMKLARAAVGMHQDSLVDAAGYLHIADLAAGREEL